MYFDSPIGQLAIRFEDSAVCELNFHPVPDLDEQTQTKLMHELNAQLRRYFSSPTSLFTLPVRLKGTDFQRRVWQALQQIPSGEVRTYGQLAEQLQSSARAVGNACRRNPVPIIVPCHRVVSASGIGGFSGSTEGAEIRIKRWLLSHEGADVPAASAS